jgi:aspartate racemase
MPVGSPGELHIGGVGLALGYLNHPERTAAKFIADPFSDDPEARLYKTGDMVRRLPDGNLEFIGRIDFQVKIRGFRVELGEIEAVLEKHPSVMQAVVIAREANGGKQLAAYVIAAPGAAPGELRDYLKKQLPEYMVPADFVFVESLPLTPNGKVDRRGLPEPGFSGSDLTTGFIAPRNEDETKMARLWAQVLGKQAVGVRDNFFDLGGHSLLALRLTSRVEKDFGRKLTLTALIQAPTVEKMARLVRADKDSWSPLVALQPAGTKPPFFFVHGLGGTVMRFHELSRHMTGQPFLCFQAQGMDGELPVLDRVDAMAELYLTHLRNAQPEGPYYFGGYSFGGLVALEMARRLTDAGQEVGLLALVDTYFVGQQANSSLVGRFLSLSFDQKVAYLKKRATRYRRGIKRRIEALSLPAAVKAVREACAVAEQSYRPSPFSVPLTLFRASEKALRGLEGAQNGWQRYAQGGLEIHEIDGDHGNILNEPNVRQLAAALLARLDLARSEQGEDARVSLSSR